MWTHFVKLLACDVFLYKKRRTVFVVRQSYRITHRSWELIIPPKYCLRIKVVQAHFNQESGQDYDYVPCNKSLTEGGEQSVPDVPSYPWAPPEMCQSLKCHQSHSKYHQRCHAMPFLQRIIGFIFVTKVVGLKQRCHSWLSTVMPSDFIVCVCVFSPLSYFLCLSFQGDCWHPSHPLGESEASGAALAVRHPCW